MSQPVHHDRGGLGGGGTTSVMKKRQRGEARWRVGSLLLFLSLVALGLSVRFYDIQVREHEKWKELATNQHRVRQTLLPERGTVFLKDGGSLFPVAINREYQLVYAAPREVTDVDALVRNVKDVLGVDEGELRDRILSRPNDPYELIKKKVSPEDAEKLRELHIAGLYITPETERFYPANELASKIIGFVGPSEEDEVGIYGVEASLNSELHGVTGLRDEKREHGWWTAQAEESTPAQDGTSVVLTIDRVIQYEVERILAEAIDKFKAEQVSAIVMEPQTGKILAMAALPQFDPNNYSQVSDYNLFINPVVSQPYEPGSVMKPFTMAMGIEEGQITPQTEFTDTGFVKEAGYTIKNAQDKVYGRSSMTKVLDESINTGVIFVEKKIGNSRFRDYMKQFGFGEKTGIRLPVENAGNTRALDNTRATINFLTASFGQGVTATPLQIAMAYGAIANGGVLMQPQIIDRFIKDDGTEETVESKPLRRVISSDTARTVSQMLRSVVTDGHGKRADIPGYQVVGKTGTAQVAKAGGGGYDETLTIGSFAGFAPMKDPRYVVLVTVNHPRDVEWAESSAAPTFGSIMQFLLNYGKVQPVETVKSK